MPELEPITREEKLLDGQDLEPITRKEMFIKRIYDKTQVVPKPITREEMFLNKAGEGGGGDITVEQLNVTENGTYSESGKAYSPVVVNVPTPPVPENAYLLNSLSGLPADIASFNDGTDLPMASLKVAVTPYQDLHGYDAPWVGGAGKNKLDIANASLAKPSWYSGGWNNASLNSDYGLTINRTYNEGGAGGFTIDNLVGGKTYTISFAVSDANLQYRVGIYYSTNGTDTTTLANSLSMQSGTGIKYYSFDLPSEAKYVCFRPTLNDGTSPYDIYKIQIEEGSSATSFAPYSNICPIIGWDEAVVTVADDAESPTTSHEYTIDLDGTRYGGVVDATNGTMDDTLDYIASYNGETLPSTWISDRDVYAEGTTPTIGAEVVYTRATPITVQLAPTPVKSLEGENKIFANCGQITEGKYFKRA